MENMKPRPCERGFYCTTDPHNLSDRTAAAVAGNPFYQVSRYRLGGMPLLNWVRWALFCCAYFFGPAVGYPAGGG